MLNNQERGKFFFFDIRILFISVLKNNQHIIPFSEFCEQIKGKNKMINMINGNNALYTILPV
jgi:hypothetical protein